MLVAGRWKLIEAGCWLLVAGSLLKELDLVDFPDDRVAICLWAVSKYTQAEEEVLVYPFLSFIAEFGGCLGLFLGFSFMTIWDGLKNLVMWAMQSKMFPRSKSLVLTL